MLMCVYVCVCVSPFTGEALRKKRAKAARAAEGPTPEMYAECQELLQLFGLPYIVAPVEVGCLDTHTHTHTHTHTYTQCTVKSKPVKGLPAHQHIYMLCDSAHKRGKMRASELVCVCMCVCVSHRLRLSVHGSTQKG